MRVSTSAYDKAEPVVGYSGRKTFFDHSRNNCSLSRILTSPQAAVGRFSAPGSNRVLDVRGDPDAAGLAVFSDGNHHGVAVAGELEPDIQARS